MAPTAELARSIQPTQSVRVVSARFNLRQRFADLWLYRELLVGLVRKELKVKYKDSILGFFWSMLNPMLYLAVFFVVFQIVLPNGIPSFATFLLSGLLVWNLFSTALPGSTGAIVGNSSIVKKVAFPREILALAPVGASLVHFFLQSIVLMGALLVFQHAPAWQYLPLIVPAMLALLLLAGALGVLLAGVNVYLRDTQHLLELVLLVWFWATPIVYPYQQVATRMAAQDLPTWLYRLNPVTPIVLTFQRIFYNRLDPLQTRPAKGCPRLPNFDDCFVRILSHDGPWWYLRQLLIVSAVSAVLYVLALRLFARLEGNFAEEL